MERIKAADAGGMLVRPRGGDGAAEGSRRATGAGGRPRRRDRGARGRPLPPAQRLRLPDGRRDPPRRADPLAGRGEGSPLSPAPRQARGGLDRPEDRARARGRRGDGVRQGRADLRLPRRPLRRHRRHRQAARSPSGRRPSSCSPPTRGPTPAARRPRWRGSWKGRRRPAPATWRRSWRAAQGEVAGRGRPAPQGDRDHRRRPGRRRSGRSARACPSTRSRGRSSAPSSRAAASRAGFPSIVGSGPELDRPALQRQPADDGVGRHGRRRHRRRVRATTRPTSPGPTPSRASSPPASGRSTSSSSTARGPARPSSRSARARSRARTPSPEGLHGQEPAPGQGRGGVEHTMDHFFIHGLGHYLGMDVHDVGDTGKPCGPARSSRSSPASTSRARASASGSRTIISSPRTGWRSCRRTSRRGRGDRAADGRGAEGPAQGDGPARAGRRRHDRHRSCASRPSRAAATEVRRNGNRLITRSSR